MANFEFRNLNDYEGMLATSTCNVGMTLLVTRKGQQGGNEGYLETTLRQAWSSCVAERPPLQVRLVKREGETGPLGQRYEVAPVSVDDHKELMVVQKIHSNAKGNLLNDLKNVGTTALDISKGSYFVTCKVAPNSEADTCFTTMQIIVSLCHALSDGPGVLQVAHSFLVHLGKVLDGKSVNPTTANSQQELTNIQAKLIGSDYSANQPPDDAAFAGQDEFKQALAKTSMATTKGASVLPPEALQNMPKDAGFGGPSVIDCVHFSLTADQTSSLRHACRNRNTTVQGVLVATALKTRLNLLKKGNEKMVAAVQIPVNTRRLAEVPETSCLCGSAGVWHTIDIPPNATNQDWWQIAQHSTEGVKAALQIQQPQEWLRRLLNNPATLPPYSLMVSSIGVAPVQASYGHCVQVDKLHFFGASLRSAQPSQAIGSMIHVVTFRDELHGLFNFQSPGISKDFAERTAQEIQQNLIQFAKDLSTV